MYIAAVYTGVHTSFGTLTYFSLDMSHGTGVTWVSLEDIMLCSQIQTKYRMFSLYVEIKNLISLT